MRTAIYVRVSTEDQTTLNQELQLMDYCKLKGFDVTHVYSESISGTRSDREQLKQMFVDAKLKRFDMLLFWSLDRLTREGAGKTFEYLNQLERYGVQWCSFSEDWMNSAGPFKTVIISLLSTLAKMEREKISQRTKAGLQRVKQNGVKLGRSKSIDRDSVKELKQNGMSNRSIARVLNVSSTAINNIVRTF